MFKIIPKKNKAAEIICNLNKINKKQLGMLSTNFCNGGNEIYEIENQID